MKVLHPQKLIDLKNIKAILLDWDGVFHSGHKNHLGESLFSEADSMGLNLLRLGYYLQNNEIPYLGIITGEHNPTAHYLAAREHFNGLFYNVKDKKVVLSYFSSIGIEPDEILFVFDDVLDLSLAELVKFRCLIHREASELFHNYAVHRNYIDLITSQDGGNHAVRALSEFILDQLGVFSETLDCRISFNEIYQNYWTKRQSIPTTKMTIRDSKLVSE